LLHLLISLSQLIDLCDEQIALTVMQINSKKVGGSRVSISNIIWHSFFVFIINNGGLRYR